MSRHQITNPVDGCTSEARIPLARPAIAELFVPGKREIRGQKRLSRTYERPQAMPGLPSSRAMLALLVFADGSMAYNMPTVLPAHRRPAAGVQSPLSGRRGALAPLRMSFVPDKKAMTENFSKIPDHIRLRDPVLLADGTTKVPLLL